MTARDALTRSADLIEPTWPLLMSGHIFVPGLLSQTIRIANNTKLAISPYADNGLDCR